MGWRLFLAVGLAVLAVVRPALAEGVYGPPTTPMAPAAATTGAPGGGSFQIEGSLKTYFLWKNDTDFDSTEPIYDVYGQSFGFVAVVFNPKFTWVVRKGITLRYWPELSGSFWSRSELNPSLDVLENQPVLLHKEIWGEVDLPWEGSAFRVGFQRYEDPTQLFLNRFVGALRLAYRTESDWLAFTVGEIPNSVYDGLDTGANNFSNDDFLFALDGRLALSERYQIRPALQVEWDHSIEDKTMVLAVPCLNLKGNPTEALAIELDLVLQAGVWTNSSIGNRNTTILAGAVQAHGRYDTGWGYFEGNLVLMSPDDSDPYNGFDSSFQFSGYSKSKTLMLSENDLYDAYDNHDEAAVATDAGFLLVDLTAGWEIVRSLEIFNILGYGSVLQDKFTNGGLSVGFEEDLGLAWTIADGVIAKLAGGILVPGEAGSALTNELGDLSARDPMFAVQGYVLVKF